jgi:hypothetical protein
LGEPSSDQLKAVFRAHGVRGEIKEVIPRAGDEAVFVLTEGDLVATSNPELVTELQALLHRKVWVGPEAVGWKGHTADL